MPRGLIRKNRWLVAALVAVLLVGLAAGCSSKGPSAGGASPKESGLKADSAQLAERGEPQASPAADQAAPTAAQPSGSSGGYSGLTSSVLGTPVPQAQRKVIQNADLSYEVTDLTDALAKIDQAVAAAGGYAADSNLTGAKENERRAHLVLRVPFTGFDTFLGRLEGLGALKARRIYTDDVTAEYLDLDARISTQKEHEARLRQILAQAKSLEDLIRLEQELSRVRGEIESMTGRLNFLKDQVEMSTVTLDLTEVKPGAPVVQPGFGKDIREAFVGMSRSLWEFSRAALVAAAATLPLLLYVAVLGFVAWRLYRWIRPWLGRTRPPAPPS